MLALLLAVVGILVVWMIFQVYHFNGVLSRYETSLQSLEKERLNAYVEMRSEIKNMSASYLQLQKETSNLVNALRRPEVRGRWGELTLRRVVELAGMVEHCDFKEQVAIKGKEVDLRPDMLVYLPSERVVVVDAKVSLDAYLEALSKTSEEERSKSLSRHASQVRQHLNKLGNKNYWEQFEKSPEFVVMFIPGESFFSAALEQEPTLLEEGIEKGVILATPTTLIALLRAISYGWRQEEISKNALEVSRLGKELYERIRTWSEHLSGVGEGLEKATSAYNAAIGSLEGRVLVTARKFKELGVTTGRELDEADPVLTRKRLINLDLSE